MAQCSICHTEMKGSTSCVGDHLPLVDGAYPPVVWGGEAADVGVRPPERGFPARCGDCGVSAGGVHHHGCDREECPRCAGQLITCGCWDGHWPGDAA